MSVSILKYVCLGNKLIGNERATSILTNVYANGMHSGDNTPDGVF